MPQTPPFSSTFVLEFDVVDDLVAFDWNGQTINFSDWADDQFGIFEYTTRNYRSYFVFDIQPVPGSSELRIYIDHQPDYQGRDAGVDIHRNLESSSGRHYVCVKSDLQPTNVPHALSWAVYFAEKTDHFIETGEPFA